MTPPEETVQEYIKRMEKRDSLSVDVMLFAFFLIVGIVAAAIYLEGVPLR